MKKVFFEVAREGPVTHAFVLGVGDYPDAKPDKGVLSDLRTVSDLPSAADSAKFMVDWLIEHKDDLVPPLGTMEVLIADPKTRADRYAWINRKPVDRPDKSKVEQVGRRWKARFRTGDVALFYACGHGAGQGGQPVVFLCDLNKDGVATWSHVNVDRIARGFRQDANVKAGFLFVDACREFIASFELDDQSEAQFISTRPSNPSREVVWLVSAATDGLLAYDGDTLAYEGYLEKSPGVRIGRFTQTLLKGLGGLSARFRNGGWEVSPGELRLDLKTLHRLYFPEWNDRPFEPSDPRPPNDIIPIIRYKQTRVPVVVLTDPDTSIDNCNLRISCYSEWQKPWLAETPGRSPYWLTEVEASNRLIHYAHADYNGTVYTLHFTPNQPHFDHRVPLS